MKTYFQLRCILGSYDAGIGSITAHPYQYQTTNYGNYAPDNHQPTSYSEEFLRSTQAHPTHSTQEPQYYPPDRHASQATFNLTSALNSQTPRHNNDSNHAPGTHKPPIDNHHYVDSNHQHQVRLVFFSYYFRAISVLERLQFNVVFY